MQILPFVAIGIIIIMIMNANFRLSGFFFLITKKISKYARTPRQLLGILIFSSGLLSTLFLNDTIVLVFTPIILEIIRTLKRNPVPYLIALAAAANVGSVGTLIGNPQNILIGTSAGISFIEFSLYLIPVALMGLLATWIILVVVFRKEFTNETFDDIILPKYRLHREIMRKSIISATLMLCALVAGVPTSAAAMGAASLLLITRRLKAERVFAEIDWSLLVFFSGLFIVTKSIETLGISTGLMDLLKINSGNEIIDLTIISVLSSNIISNVPAVLLLKPGIAFYSNPKIAWLTLAMATTFAGNLTLLGSVANLIVAESAKKRGVLLGFKEYLKGGIPITIVSLFIGILWLSLFYS